MNMQFDAIFAVILGLKEHSKNEIVTAYLFASILN